ncbi:AAA family ATPase [Longispora sp. NPDC051575]|uniref:AAA family ATPase n=1 Tax=Longispora sp. NPDC051575 TaxID=3154943 RepID=UPI00341DD871
MPQPFTRLIGRQRELALLTDPIAGLRQGGRAVFLVAEAGLGKSRLGRETAAAAARSGVPVLRGRADAAGTAMPFRPLTEAISSLLRDSGPPDAPELLLYRPALARLIPQWRQDDRAAPDLTLIEVAEALLRLLRHVGGPTGCVLLLDDLHDADTETLTVLGYLLDNLADLPVLLVASSRPEPCPAMDLAHSAARRRVAELVELGPLGSDDVALLAAAVLGVEVGGVPGAVLDRMDSAAGGNPFFVEELVTAMTDSGVLRHGPGGWHLTGVDPPVPATIVHGVRERVRRLGDSAEDLLRIAATLGPRFTLTVVRSATGLDEATVLRIARAAVAARLLEPDETGSDWYAFRHALTAEALLGDLLPPERAALARRAADAVEHVHPAPADAWLTLAADLRCAAGQDALAADLLAEAGRRALAAGFYTSAVAPLERSHQLRPVTGLQEPLVRAHLAGGHIDRALGFVGELPVPYRGSAEERTRAELHADIAFAAVMAERIPEATEQLAVARDLLRDDPAPGPGALLDVVDARLIFLGSGPLEDRIAVAGRLARQAADTAERRDLPDAACRAWQFLAVLARENDYAEADRCLERMLAVAEEHDLPGWRLDALLRLGVTHFLRTGEVDRLRQAQLTADRAGAIARSTFADLAFAIMHVLRGDYGTAAEVVERADRVTARMRHPAARQDLMVAQAALAGHRGLRADLERCAPEDGPDVRVTGLGYAVCALLEEDHDRAAADLDAVLAQESQHPSAYQLAGGRGLRLLVEAHAGRAGWPEYEDVVRFPSAGVRWNRQFVLFARAVLLGRSGRPDAAAEAFEEAVLVAEPFPMAGQLGRRLVAEAAITDGWGEPAGWLRSAEEYFHGAGVPAVAGACRSLLRRIGAPRPHRRRGIDAVPGELARLGVSVREYEVLVLLAGSVGNVEIGRRLFISPRTVEKHVASVLGKLGLADRGAVPARVRGLVPTP